MFKTFLTLLSGHASYNHYDWQTNWQQYNICQKKGNILFYCIYFGDVAKSTSSNAGYVSCFAVSSVTKLRKSDILIFPGQSLNMHVVWR
jgi:hypothetical protein